MSKTGNLFKGLYAYINAHRIIIRFRLWPYLIIPGILSLAYIVSLIILGTLYTPEISNHINTYWIPAFMQGKITGMLTMVLIWFLFPILGYMSYKYVILILFSPILGYLSEIVEEKIYHREPPPFRVKALLRDLCRGLIINFRNMFLTVFYTFLLWLLVFIPGIGMFLSPALIIVMQAFYDGFALFDFTLERKRYSVGQSIRFGRRHRITITGVGLGFMLLLLIPIIGWFAAPTYGAIAATVNALETIQKELTASST